MAKSLGIFVTSSKNMHHVMGVTKAAVAKGSKVKVFFSWKGAKLSKDARFPELCKIADVSICIDSYVRMGFDKEDIPEGLNEKQMSTQSEHGDIISNYDCYMTL